MQSIIDSIRQQFASDKSQVKSTKDLESIKVKYLGKKGLLSQQLRSVGEIALEDRPLFGKLVNELKEEISLYCEEQDRLLQGQEEGQRLKEEYLDITLPGRSSYKGSKHPIIQMMQEIVERHVAMGFSVQLGPDVESEYYNFEALNFPPDHPARDMQDTFYIAPKVLLRTHTTNTQVRIMETAKPPIRIVLPGRVYRNETITSRSHVFFHQVDAVYIDEKVSFNDLIGTLTTLLKKLFAENVRTRFRPSYFPFTEPSIEVDIGCLVCNGSGCSLCKHSGWLEVLGAGMVHPQVLRNGEIDPERYTGFAWGMGVERVFMLKHQVKDIRLFAENDLRFLRQFPAV